MVKDRKAQANAPGGAVPWNVVVSVAEVPPTGRHVELKPDATTREAIAKRAGVLEVPQLEATFELAPHGSEGLRVSGRVVGSVVQSCVVTLEPVTNEIDEEVDLLFMPPREPPKATEPVDDSGEVAGSPALDAPEELDNGTVDLAALTLEFLNLAIDPYPRKPGAVFASAPVGDSGPHPFAALAALKKDK
mgnify:FL=1|jgi:uncharacterized metal-binding protein YceD (DUF177 family)